MVEDKLNKTISGVYNQFNNSLDGLRWEIKSEIESLKSEIESLKSDF